MNFLRFFKTVSCTDFTLLKYVLYIICILPSLLHFLDDQDLLLEHGYLTEDFVV